jgi:hypothetical protein
VVLFRALLLLLLLAAAVSFGLYAFTGKPHYKRQGMLILKWTLLAALGFFLVLAGDRLLSPPSSLPPP